MAYPYTHIKQVGTPTDLINTSINNKNLFKLSNLTLLNSDYKNVGQEGKYGNGYYTGVSNIVWDSTTETYWLAWYEERESNIAHHIFIAGLDKYGNIKITKKELFQLAYASRSMDTIQLDVTSTGKIFIAVATVDYKIYLSGWNASDLTNYYANTAVVDLAAEVPTSWKYLQGNWMRINRQYSDKIYLAYGTVGGTTVNMRYQIRNSDGTSFLAEQNYATTGYNSTANQPFWVFVKTATKEKAYLFNGYTNVASTSCQVYYRYMDFNGTNLSGSTYNFNNSYGGYYYNVNVDGDGVIHCLSWNGNSSYGTNDLRGYTLYDIENGNYTSYRTNDLSSYYATEQRLYDRQQMGNLPNGKLTWRGLIFDTNVSGYMTIEDKRDRYAPGDVTSPMQLPMTIEGTREMIFYNARIYTSNLTTLGTYLSEQDIYTKSVTLSASPTSLFLVADTDEPTNTDLQADLIKWEMGSERAISASLGFQRSGNAVTVPAFADGQYNQNSIVIGNEIFWCASDGATSHYIWKANLTTGVVTRGASWVSNGSDYKLLSDTTNARVIAVATSTSNTDYMFASSYATADISTSVWSTNVRPVAGNTIEMMKGWFFDATAGKIYGGCIMAATRVFYWYDIDIATGAFSQLGVSGAWAASGTSYGAMVCNYDNTYYYCLTMHPEDTNNLNYKKIFLHRITKAGADSQIGEVLASEDYFGHSTWTLVYFKWVSSESRFHAIFRNCNEVGLNLYSDMVRYKFDTSAANEDLKILRLGTLTFENDSPIEFYSQPGISYLVEEDASYYYFQYSGTFRDDNDTLTKYRTGVIKIPKSDFTFVSKTRFDYTRDSRIFNTSAGYEPPSMTQLRANGGNYEFISGVAYNNADYNATTKTDFLYVISKTTPEWGRLVSPSVEKANLNINDKTDSISTSETDLLIRWKLTTSDGLNTPEVYGYAWQ